MAHWATESVFYHIYPLALCGAPTHNDFSSAPVPRLESLQGWLSHLQGLEVNALYLGPLLESSTHGYDTADYFHLDRRLGSNDTLKRLVQALHSRGIRVILDGVFNHVGRSFWAFRDLLEHGEASAYRGWFRGLHFGQRNPHGDPFTYDTWNGHGSLVCLNLSNPEVREHLFGAVEMWIREFEIDGLRLDTADCLDLGFQQALAAHCRRLRPDFWLLGEVVHGDYRRWANPETLDSVTNYQCYKGLYSSHVDRNYHELAYTLNRQFGEHGIYRGLPLYNFVDNHDVNRVASNLTEPAHLYPLYCLLFTMPGVPSIYYGSEWGIAGRRTATSDRALRPQLDPTQTMPHPDLARAIARLAHLRRRSPALCHGSYRQLHVAHEQFAFARQVPGQCIIVAVNAACHALPIDISIPTPGARRLVDLLNEGDTFPVRHGRAYIDKLWPRWGRIMEVE